MRKNKKRAKILLLLLILCISVGYAILQSNLNIQGTANMNNPTWDIHWNNVQITSSSVTGSNVTTPATIDEAKTTVSYSIKLPKPGDFYEFTVDAVNGGTIDAMIDTISSKLNGTEISTLPDYLVYSVTYASGVAIEPNQVLKANTSEKYKVRIEFKKNIEASQLPSNIQSLNLQFSVNYKQATSDAIEVHKVIYRNSTITAKIGDYVDPQEVFGYVIVNGNGERYDGYFYQTESECQEQVDNYPPGPVSICQPGSVIKSIGEYTSDPSTLNRPYYLKHIIGDNKILSSYACFVIDNEEYCLQGGDEAYEVANRALLESIQSKFYGCSSFYDQIKCYCEGFQSISSRASVFVNLNLGGGNGCWVHDINTESGCYFQ